MNHSSKREELGPEDFHYIKHVLRLKPGDTLLLFDGRGTEYEAVISQFGAKTVQVDITATHRFDDIHLPMTLAQALPKDNKMDFIVQKSTELGVSRIIPFTSSRTIPKLTGEKAAARIARWRKISAEASKQCGSTRVPMLEDIMPFTDMLEAANRHDARIMFWEEEPSRGLRNILQEAPLQEKAGFFIIVGPEGGFSRAEAAQAQERDFVTAHLGRRILRVETAALVILSILHYERGSLGSLLGEDGC